MHTSTLLKSRSWGAAFLGCAAALLSWLPTSAAPQRATDPPAPARAGAVAAPAEPHWQFVPNRNQWPERVQYAVDLPVGKLYLEKGRLTHALYDRTAVDELQHHPAEAANGRVKAHAYSVNFEGADANAAMQASGQAVTQRNYFLGNDPNKWATKVPAFAEVRYQQLYPGTDLRLYSRADALEYDFELAAGADPRRIKLRYDGAESLRIAADGTLRIGTSVGEVLEQRPVAYQLLDGKRREVPCEFRLDGRTVTFALPKGYNRRQPLVIDPVLVYSSYSGSTGSNYGYTATYDSLGNLYAGGVVFSTGFPVTSGAYDVSFGGNRDMGILKFNPTATNGPASLLYATYIGGAGTDHPHSMVVDHQGNLVILGSTDASTFPVTTNTYDPSFNGNTDVVLCKLSNNGSSLLGSTFVGGSGADGQISGTLQKNYGDNYRGDVLVDNRNYVYFASVSRSNNFPSTGFQRSLSGSSDAVVAKFTPALNGLEWSSYLGGSGEEAGYSLQLDSLRNVVVSGGTTSSSMPGTAGALNASSRGGTDGFVARISADGQTLQRNTFLGTGSYDQAYFVQLDRAANVYVLGQTEGSYPVTPGVYVNQGARLFLHKLNYALTATQFSTTLGASGGSTVNMSPTAFLIDNCGQVLLSAWGGSFSLGTVSNAPTTPDAIQTSAGSGGSFYLMQLSRNAGRLVYGSFFGTSSPHVDGGTSRFDKRGIIYQSMCVSGGMPTTNNAFSLTNRGGYNNGAFKMDILQLRADFVLSSSPTGPRVRSGCAPFQVYFRPGTQVGNSFRWSFGDGTSSNQMGTVGHVYNTPGRYIVTLTVLDTTACLQAKTAVDTVQVFGVPAAAAGPDRSICAGGSAQLSAAAAGVAGTTYAWSPATGLSAITGPTVTATPAATTTYFLTVTSPGGCARRDTVVVRVFSEPQVNVTPSATQTFTNRPVTFANTTQGATAYRWDFGDGQTSTEAAPVHAYTAPNTYRVRLVITYGNNCTLERTFSVEVRSFELPNVITPNGDGQNDSFKPVVAFEPVTLQVFNRWGRKIYTQPNYNGTWGTDNVPAGVYYYQLTTQSGESWKGWVEVMR